MKIGIAVLAATIVLSAILLPKTRAQVQDLTASTMYMKTGLLEQSQEVWAAFVLNELKESSIKDMDYDQGHAQDNTLYIPKVKEDTLNDHVTSESIPYRNAFKIIISDLQLGFLSQQFKFKSTFITLKGAVDVHCTGVQMNTTFGVERQSLSDGRKALAFSVLSFELGIPDDRISMVVHGNIETKVSHEFKKVFITKLTEQIEKGMELTLKTRMIPKLNKIISDSGAYLEMLPGILFDASLQSEPVIDMNYFGLEMTGLFSPVNGTELTPKDLEDNSTDPVKLTHLYDPSGANFQLYLHQMSLDSILVSYLKRNTISSWMLSQNVDQDAKFNLTTTGLNEVFVQTQTVPAPPPVVQGKNKIAHVPSMKQPNGTGFVAKFGADKQVDILFKVEGIHNYRVKEDNATMTVDADLSIEFWVNNQQDQALDLSIKNCIIFFDVEYQTDANFLFNQVQDVVFGDINVDNSALGQGPHTDGKEKANFGLDIKKMRKYLNQIKLQTLMYLNRYLVTQNYSLPQTMFFGVFDFKESKARFTFHEGYLGLHFEPVCKTPQYDETSEPRFIFQAFTGQQPPAIDSTNFVYEETMSEDGEIMQKRVRDFSLIESFSNQVQIFGEVPPIQN